ncbi:FixH family protein [Devosia albogilva]|uniref:FixH family protein n=1 Tax=Devosia albogilva TaxID=429726 RepID=A0ABW5QHJ0_9HYPH
MSASKPREFTGRHMLLVTCTFFGVIISVNLVMAISASRTWTGLVVQNSYVESQRFDDKHNRIRAQVEAGWRFATSYEDGKLVFRASDADGAVLPLEQVSAFIHRPVGGHDDQTLPLTPSESGYAAAVALPSGVWDVIVTTGETSLGPIEFERRVTVP